MENREWRMRNRIVVCCPLADSRFSILGSRFSILFVSLLAFAALTGARTCALAQPCVADCNRDGVVSVEEVITGARIALGESTLPDCPEMDVNADGVVAIDDLLAGVRNALEPWTTAKVDIGGFGLKIRCMGAGTPVVVLDSALGGTIQDWARVQPEIAMFTRVCAYNRAGNGGSDVGPFPRTSGQIVSELHMLLPNACLPQPYVLVGHSFGGQDVRLYASRHGDEVAGLVTVDGTQEDFWDEISARISPDLTAALLRQQDEIVAVLSESVRSEWDVREQRFAELRASGPLPSVPLIVLVAGQGGALPPPFEDDAPAVDAIWDELQARFAASVPGSTLRTVADAGHYIQLDRPDAVIDAIQSVVDDVRARGLAF
jgi:pimeloyl-ACP methyl ester carboxylesterase